MKNRYGSQITAIKDSGAVTDFEDALHIDDPKWQHVNQSLQRGFSRIGSKIAFFQKGLDESASLIIADGVIADTKSDSSQPESYQLKNIKPVWRELFGQTDLSQDGNYLAFASLATVEDKIKSSEVYYYDIKANKLNRVYDASGSHLAMHVVDPDFSPSEGGSRWMVMVRSFDETDQLYVYDTKEKRGYVITEQPRLTQLANPRFSADGEKIVVSRKDPQTGYRDIVVFDKMGRELQKLTQDIYSDNHPVFDATGQYVYFDSYRSGVSNIHKADLKNLTVTQVTNVLDGVFEPQIVDDRLFMMQYRPQFSKIVSMKLPNSKDDSVASSSSAIHPNLVSVMGDVKRHGIEPVQEIKSQNYDVYHMPNGQLAVKERDKVNPESLANLVPKTVDKSPATVTLTPMQNLLPQVSLQQNTKVSFSQQETSRDNEPAAQILGDLHRMSLHPDLNLGFNSVNDVDEKASDDSLNHQNKNDEPQKLEVQESGSKEQKQGQKNKIVDTEIRETTVKEKSEQKIYPSAYRKDLQQFKPEKKLELQDIKGAKKYQAFPRILRPHYVSPAFYAQENAMLIGAYTGNVDPLYRHAWSAFANYRTDAGFLGAGALYTFMRYTPSYYIGVNRYAVDNGSVLQDNTATADPTDKLSVDFFEERNQVYGGVGFNIKRHRFNTAYFYEHRQAYTDIGNVNFFNMAPYAGWRVTYNNSKTKKYPHSISQEDGYAIKAGLEWTDEKFGADSANEERAIHGDARYYFEMPWSNHHVLALRASAGWVWGDLQQFGSYRMGGPFGEGIGAGYSSRIFPLRGLVGISFAGDQAVLFSGEYRLPLIVGMNRGVGTWPILIDRLSLNFFADAGDIRYRYVNETVNGQARVVSDDELFSRLMLSLGTELAGDFVVGYGLPVRMRLGYGVIVTNRDRIAGFQDTLTGLDADKGVFYFQLGTMF